MRKIDKTLILWAEKEIREWKKFIKLIKTRSVKKERTNHDHQRIH